jgi:hypothetical protein
VSNLINEILLRLAKLIAAGVVGGIVFAVAVGLLGAPASFEVAALSWISASVGLLLVESSPL